MGQILVAARILHAVWGGTPAVFITAHAFAAQAALKNPAEVELPDLNAAEQDVLDMPLEQLARADVVVPATDIVVSTVSRLADFDLSMTAPTSNTDTPNTSLASADDST